MKLPNGFGSVSKLSGNRRRPYIIRKSMADGSITIGYAATRTEALSLLSQYNANPWIPTMPESRYRVYMSFGGSNASRNVEPQTSPHFKRLMGIVSLWLECYTAIFARTICRAVIDNCGKGVSTQAAIKSLWAHLDKFILKLDIIAQQYSELLTTATAPTSHVPFAQEEVIRLWVY